MVDKTGEIKMKQTGIIKESIDLLDCPFCGKKITEDSIEIDDLYFYSINCYCGVKNGCYNTTDEAIQAWNNRSYKNKRIKTWKKKI